MTAATGALRGVLAGLGSPVVGQELVEGHDGRSGAVLQRIRLADGRALVLKCSDPATDLTLVVTGGLARERLLWEEGVLDRLPAPAASAVVAAVEDHGHTVTVMRDVGAAIPGWDRVLTTGERRQVLDAITAVHAAFAGTPPAAAGPLEERVTALFPTRLARAGSDHPLVDAIHRGWAVFATLPPVVGTATLAAVRRLHADPAPLLAALGARTPTLLHGDLWPVNLALTGEEVVLLDWALATAGPPAVDLAVLLTAGDLGAPPERVVAEFCERSPETGADEVHLALLLGLLDMGWNKALDATCHPDPALRVRAADELAWWVGQAGPGIRLLGADGGR